MLPSQEPKYGIHDGQIVNRLSGAPIPDDEPIFVCRANDRLAGRILSAYFIAIEDSEHVRRGRPPENFKRFAREHPERIRTRTPAPPRQDDRGCSRRRSTLPLPRHPAGIEYPSAPVRHRRTPSAR